MRHSSCESLPLGNQLIERALTDNEAADAAASLVEAAATCAATGPLFALRLNLDGLRSRLRLGSWTNVLGGLSELTVVSARALEVAWSLDKLRLDTLVRPLLCLLLSCPCSCHL